MKRGVLTLQERKQIDVAVEHFVQSRHLFESFAQSLTMHLGENPELAPYIHFIKYRVKDAEHLRDKLRRKGCQAKLQGEKPSIDKSNLFASVNDLAGVRILHLHTAQVAEMNRMILEILNEHRYSLVEGPTAICWDREYEELYNRFGIETEARDSMYTSVHYIVEANQKTKITAELQVRTLMDEVWGQVSHRVNYPKQSMSRACREQLKVLARFTTGCTRLVDSMFRSDDEEEE